MDIGLATVEDIANLIRWFPSREAISHWGGPAMRFPHSTKTTLEDIRWGEISSYVLKNFQGELRGFGQYYEKNKRCHLARLAIHPQYQSQGLGKQFISQLMSMGLSNLDLKECSLFVVKNNKKAIRCYEQLGFSMQPSPETGPLFRNIEFMVCLGPPRLK